MALLDFLKNKESAEKSKKAVKSAPRASVGKKPAKAKKEPKKEGAEPTTEKTAVTSSASLMSTRVPVGLLKFPHISEKASLLAEKNNQYTFNVMSSANKTEVRKSIEGKYKVNVTKVNIVNIHPKKRRLGATQGFKKGFKKAIITLKKGQKIEII